MEGGKEQNYWPGFVDALSNVVLTLVFVLVVFVFALVMASNKVERKAAEMVQAAHEKAEAAAAAAAATDPTRTIETLQEKLTQAEEEITELKKKLPPEDTERLSDRPSLIMFGAVKITQSPGKITVYYPGAVSDLDEKSRVDLGAILDTLKEAMKGKKIAIHSYTGVESFSAARRLAYYRAMGVRNLLLGRPDLSAAPIASRIEQSREAGNGRVEIVYGEK